MNLNYLDAAQRDGWAFQNVPSCGQYRGTVRRSVALPRPEEECAFERLVVLAWRAPNGTRWMSRITIPSGRMNSARRLKVISLQKMRAAPGLRRASIT